MGIKGFYTVILFIYFYNKDVARVFFKELREKNIYCINVKKIMGCAIFRLLIEIFLL